MLHVHTNMYELSSGLVIDLNLQKYFSSTLFRLYEIRMIHYKYINNLNYTYIEIDYLINHNHTIVMTFSFTIRAREEKCYIH